MSRALKSPEAGRQRVVPPSYRRLNRNVDHTDRNKRRVFAFLCAAVVVIAVAAIALSLAPLLNR